MESVAATHHHYSIEEYRKYMLPVLTFRNVVLRSGQGAYVQDSDGNSYLDLNSGQFCSVFGHSDPGVARVMAHITQTLQDTDTSTLSESVLIAAKKVHDIAEGMNARILFLSTGAEANECCLRYAKHIKEKPGIVSFDKGFHGLTHGTAAYSISRAKIRPPVDYSYAVPVPAWFSTKEAPFDFLVPYIEAFKTIVEQNKEHIAAAIFEPIVSGGGFYFPPANYFREIRRICDEYEILLIFDECQTGFARTGTWFMYQQLGVIPDFVVSAKAMGLGYPVACVIANGKTVNQEHFIMEHFSSHQNEPFAGFLVSYLIDRITNERLLQSIQELGAYLLQQLKNLEDKFQTISKSRGAGLMCAFDLNFGGDSKVAGNRFCCKALDQGLLLQHCNMGKTIRLLPNYRINRGEIDVLISRLEELLSRFECNNQMRKEA